MSRFLFVFLLSCFAASQVLAQQTGVVQSDATLRAQPSATAAAAGKISAKSKVEVLDRKGFWLKVKSASAAGWIKMSAVSTEGGASSSSGLKGLSSGRLGSGNIVSASGTRGLSSEELKSAKPNPEAVMEVRKMAISREEAARFATAGKLKTRKIGYVGVSARAGARSQTVE
jgi:hypothetical protein